MPTKKSTKKPAVKRSPARKTSKKAAKSPAMRSFRLSRDTTAFTTVQFTRQTVYWLIFSVVVFVFAIWILNIQVQITQLTDSIMLTN